MSKEAKLERVRRNQARKYRRQEEEWIKEFVIVAQELGQTVEEVMNMNWLQYNEIRSALIEIKKEEKREMDRVKTI